MTIKYMFRESSHVKITCYTLQFCVKIKFKLSRMASVTNLEPLTADIRFEGGEKDWNALQVVQIFDRKVVESTLVSLLFL